MNMTLKKLEFVAILTLVVIFLEVTVASAAAPKTIRKYPIPEHGVLELNVPSSWTIEVHQPQKGMSPTIIFRPAKGKDFQVLITVLWNKTGEQDFNSPDRVKTFVEKDGQKLLSKTVETKIALRELKGAHNTGYYYSLTEKAPSRGNTATGLAEE